MYCKNCGAEISDIAVVCVHCGVAKGQGTNYCFNCGNALTPGAAFCMTCGAPANATQANVPYGYEQKSKLAAGLLGVLLGFLGIHNFYLGETGKGIAQLLITVLSCGTLFFVSWVWGLIEGIMILTGSISTDSKGVPLKE